MDLSWWSALGNRRRWVFSRPLDLLIDQYVSPSTKRWTRHVASSAAVSCPAWRRWKSGRNSRNRVWLRSTGWRWRRILKWSPPTPCFWPSTLQHNLKVKVALFVPNPMRCFNCNKFGHTSQRCKVVEKISMKVNVRDPSCALIAMVPTLHRLKIARSGRRRRFNVFALWNTYLFRKPDCWLKPRCRLWSFEVRPKPLALPPEESPNLFNVKPR